ncbi:MAG: DNA repair protein RecN [Paracoccaceae bacterium]|nr:DNA repair protein RecN [Paracoccaceae bacterium]
MLSSLEIHNILLIEKISINFTNGLNVFTGETGAGKSILLDCMNFVLGGRGRANYVRHGAEQGEVIATFNLPSNHDVWEILKQAGFENYDNELIIKRINYSDGKKVAFINDQRCSNQILRELSKSLIEIQDQNDDNGLRTDQGPRKLLDIFGGLESQINDLRDIWNFLHIEKNKLIEVTNKAEKIKNDEEYIKHAINELTTLAPQFDEDILLDDRRRFIKLAEKTKVELQKSYEILDHGLVEKNIDESLRNLTQLGKNSELNLEVTIELLENASNGIMGATKNMLGHLSSLNFEGDVLQEVEERLFSIREMSRKYKVSPNELDDLSIDLSNRLKELESFTDTLEETELRIIGLEKKYNEVAQGLTKNRIIAAKKLDDAMRDQLPALKLEQAVFTTSIDSVSSSINGNDKVSFNVATNPGLPLGPISKIASGGELSRFLLGLKVSLADLNHGVTLVFDEIDSGVGGATADAVGRRLRSLASGSQILAVTHSPQVAALGNHHIKVIKYTENSLNSINIVQLSPTERMEEIGRMLSGGTITSEARSAAKVLLRG